MEAVWPASFSLQECVREGSMRTAPQESLRRVNDTATLFFSKKKSKKETVIVSVHVFFQ